MLRNNRYTVCGGGQCKCEKKLGVKAALSGQQCKLHCRDRVTFQVKAFSPVVLVLSAAAGRAAVTLYHVDGSRLSRHPRKQQCGDQRLTATTSQLLFLMRGWVFLSVKIFLSLLHPMNAELSYRSRVFLQRAERFFSSFFNCGIMCLFEVVSTGICLFSSLRQCLFVCLPNYKMDLREIW